MNAACTEHTNIKGVPMRLIQRLDRDLCAREEQMIARSREHEEEMKELMKKNRIKIKNIKITLITWFLFCRKKERDINKTKI